MENHFDILGINLIYAKIMFKHTTKERQRYLSHLRRYYSSFLHPDVHGAPHHVMARINMALDAINTYTGFQRAYTEYVKRGSRKSTGSSSYVDALREHLKWENGHAAKQEQELRDELVTKEKEIENLKVSMQQLNQSRDELGAAKRQSEHLLRRFIYNLTELINSPGNGYEIPEGSLPICDLVGKTLSLNWEMLEVDRNLMVSRRGKGGSGLACRRISFGTLIGCIFPEIIKRKGNIGPGSSAYNHYLLNLKFYFRRGMYLVTIRSAESDNLHFYGPINNVV